MLALALAGIIAILRARAVPGHRTGPAWQGGLAPSPGFNPAPVDPGLAQPLRLVMGPSVPFLNRATLPQLVARLEALTLRQTLTLIVTGLILALTTLAVAEQL